MNLKEQKVFIPINVEERLPEIIDYSPVRNCSDNLFLLDGNEKHVGNLCIPKDGRVKQSWSDFDGGKVKPTHWLEEKEAIVLSKREARDFINDFGTYIQEHIDLKKMGTHAVFCDHLNDIKSDFIKSKGL